jgi:hypothetical protein
LTLSRTANDSLLADTRTFDHAMMEALLAHSSSGPAREAAAAWLASFETAQAVGTREDEAYARANEAWRRAATRVQLWPARLAA